MRTMTVKKSIMLSSQKIPSTETKEKDNNPLELTHIHSELKPLGDKTSFMMNNEPEVEGLD